MHSINNHNFNNTEISQVKEDGFIHLTAMCKAAGKQLGHYKSNKQTVDFLSELSSDIGIPISQLMIVKKGNRKGYKQGTWAHPLVAINLAQWASPEVSVWVSKLVFDWQSGRVQNKPRIEANSKNGNDKRYIEARTVLTPKELLALKCQIDLHVENSFPNNQAIISVTDVNYRLCTAFDVASIDQILSVDFKKAMDMVDPCPNLANINNGHYVVLRLFDEISSKITLTDQQLVEKKVAELSIALMNIVRDRPLSRPVDIIRNYEH